MTNSGEKMPSAITAAVARVLESGAVAVLATLVSGPTNIGAKAIVEADGKRQGSFGDESLDEAITTQSLAFLDSNQDIRVADLGESKVLFERIQAEPRLVICGAGHVGASLASLGAMLGYRPTLIDDRAEFVTRERFADARIELIVADKWSDAVTRAVGNGHGVFVSIVTRGHAEDEQCLRAVLANATPDYVGMIGSKRRTRIVLDRLREDGTHEENLARVHAPIGLDIGAVTPEEVALAIMAEIVTHRRGGRGGSLSDVSRGKGKR